ncbi:uncharacterized protein LOC121726985 [Aricia agestis]|uniref:uncharacterized protein LOC121726985 n=1 Tax=Aricia agestis TaxID=91739 RepID=UPI001C20503A|nr:uncharacterized protein LOC121726985 [Aricia agestis]
MRCIHSWVVGLFCLALTFKFGYSIFCYDCNSAFDPRCGEEFDPFSLGVINCSLRDPPDHIAPVESTFCRTIKMEIYGKVRIVRQCGFIPNEGGNHTCRKQTGTGELFVTYCTCNTDLCNAGSTLDRKMALGLVVLMLLKRIV